MAKVEAETLERPKPTINLDEDDLPEIKNWRVGKKYKLAVEVEQMSLSKGGMFEEDKKMEARFRILKVKDITEKDPLEMSNKEFQKMKTRALRGH